jgi:hypothetical protein
VCASSIVAPSLSLNAILRLNCEERPSRPAAHRRRRREQLPVRRRIHGEYTRLSRSPFCRRE